MSEHSGILQNPDSDLDSRGVGFGLGQNIKRQNLD